MNVIIFAICLLFAHIQAEPELKVLKGCQITPYVREVADLQRTVFREYPHLYVGPAQEYYEYAEIYNQPSAIACLLFIDNHLIAAVTGIKFDDMYPEFKKPFYERSIDTADMFYLGELVVLKEHRNKGYGALLLKEFEKGVRSTPSCKQICLCTMDESEVIDLKPADAPDKDIFWQKKGYIKHPELVAITDWIVEGDTAPRDHKLIFWLKSMQ